MQFPPFGNTVCASREIYIFIGPFSCKKAYKFQIQKPGTLCLPPYVSPFNYKWPVKDKDILIFDTGWCSEDYIKEIAKCLLIYRANIVRFVNRDGKLSIFNKGEYK